MLVRAIDTDNYDGAIPVQDFIDLREQHGILGAIVGCQIGDDGANYTAVQRDNARAGGLVVFNHYDFLYWDGSGAKDLERMRRAAGYGLPVYMDEETEGGFLGAGWSIQQVIDRIGAAKAVLIQEGQWGGHYTNPGWWARFTGNTAEFAGDPLWLATWLFGGGVLPPDDYLPHFIPGQPGLGGMSLAAQQYADVCWKVRPEQANFDLDAIWVPDAPPAPAPAPQPILTRFTRTDEFSDGTRWILTGAYDAPPTP